MGFVLSTSGIHRLHTVAVDTGFTGLRAAVIATGGSITDAAIEDADFVNNIIGQSGETEVTNTNYARQTLAGVTVAKDETNNWVLLSATAPVINNVAAGSVWRRILYYFNVGAEGAAGDASHVVLGIDTPAATLTPNGGNVTLPALQVRLNDTSV